MSMHVTIVVLNWNNAADTLVCLTSLAALIYAAYDVLVVDNGSTDDSVARIRAWFPDTPILETGANLGYAGGNNAGIRRALARGADYVLVLNNDVIVAPGSITALVSALQSDVNAGLSTPLIADAAQPDTIWTMGAQVDRRGGTVERLYVGTPIDDTKALAPFNADIAPGSAMLVKRQVFDQVGLFDDQFFLYYEEADWCLRVRRAGFNIVVAPSSIVWHRVSATLGKSSPVTDYYMARNQLRFISRHWSGAAKIRLLVKSATKQMIAIIAYTIKPNHGERTPNRNARLLGLRDALLGRTGAMDHSTRIACRLEAR